MNKYTKPLISSVATLTILSSLTGVLAFAKDNPNFKVTPVKEEPKVFQSVESTKLSAQKSDAVLTQAEQLNQKIMAEIEKVRKEDKNYKPVINTADAEKEAINQKTTNSLQDLKDLQAKNRLKGYNVGTQTGLTADQLEQALQGTGLQGLGKYYIEAEQTYNVSALALAAMSALESQWGTSNFAKTRNNLFGWQAYDADVQKARHFKSKEEAIMTVAKTLRKNYLTPTGPYFNGVTLYGINVKYASDVNWADKNTDLMNRILDAIH